MIEIEPIYRSPQSLGRGIDVAYHSLTPAAGIRAYHPLSYPPPPPPPFSSPGTFGYIRKRQLNGSILYQPAERDIMHWGRTTLPCVCSDRRVLWRWCSSRRLHATEYRGLIPRAVHVRCWSHGLNIARGCWLFPGTLYKALAVGKDSTCQLLISWIVQVCWLFSQTESLWLFSGTLNVCCCSHRQCRWLFLWTLSVAIPMNGISSALSCLPHIPSFVPAHDRFQTLHTWHTGLYTNASDCFMNSVCSWLLP